MRRVDPAGLEALGAAVLRAVGCTPAIAAEMSAHLVEAEAMGVTSHGVLRLASYAAAAENGEYEPGAEPVLTRAAGGAVLVDGAMGFGVPALRLAMDAAVTGAKETGAAAVGVARVFHTGRIGACAARAASANCLGIVTGGGGRVKHPQVAPFGGKRGLLPTNPWAFAAPGGPGAPAPVVVDFASSASAQGKLMAIRAAGGKVPEGTIIDREGRPSTDPEDFYAGGAILPASGPKGYGLALMAELLASALMGPSACEANWLVVAIDLGRFAGAETYAAEAGALLAEVRAAEPQPGFERVEIPGEREVRLRDQAMRDGIALPDPVASRIGETARRLGVVAALLNA